MDTNEEVQDVKIEINELYSSLVNLDKEIINIREYIFKKEFDEIIKERIENLESFLQIQGKSYIQNDEVNLIIKGYKEALNKIFESYLQIRMKFVKNRDEWKKFEYEQLELLILKKKEKKELKKSEEYLTFREEVSKLRKELYRVTVEENMEEVKNKTEELDKLLENDEFEICEKIMANCKKNIKETRNNIRERDLQIKNLKGALQEDIDRVLDNKDKALTEVKNVSFIKKLLSIFTNKRSGAKKFNEDILNPLKSKLEKVEGEIISEIQDKNKNDEETIIQVSIQKLEQLMQV